MCWLSLTCWLLASNILLSLRGVAAAAPQPTSLLSFDLRYTDSLSRLDAYEHQHLIAALSGLANREAPRLYGAYTGVDDSWVEWLQRRGGWLEATSLEVFPSGSTAHVAALLRRLSDTFAGFVVYDPTVPATSNVASTAAGVESLLPVAHRPGQPGSLYELLVEEQAVEGKPVLLDLVGLFNGSSGSSKAEAYLWAKGRYLDARGERQANPAKLAYYVDYFGALPAPPAPPAPPCPAGKDTLASGEILSAGERLMSVNQRYHMEVQTDGNLVVYDGCGAAQKVIWTSNTAGSVQDGKAFLAAQTNGNLVLYKGTDLNSHSEAIWSTGTGRPTEGSYWLWMQHDGNLVLYEGVCCSGTVVWDAGSGTVVWDAPASDFHLTQTTNQDYFIAHKAFFVDLSVWDDEAPNDDPHQPLGTDKATFLAVLKSAYDGTGSQEMIHMGGFTPWHFKYVSDGNCGGSCKHGGVETEWESMRIFTTYNVFADADACCIGSMSNAALWQHHPLPERFEQKFQRPTLDQLRERGYIAQDDTVVPRAYSSFYAGDYDSAAWLYSQLWDRWDDGGRGSVPIGWAINPELSMRFPVIYARLYDSATELDAFISGDSGAGYLNPTQLLPPRSPSGITESGGPLWEAWNQRYYERFNLSFTGFIIQGAAGKMTPAAEALYASFSPDGIVLQAGADPAGDHDTGGVTAEGVPVMHHVMDLPPEVDVEAAVQGVLQIAGGQQGSAKATFSVYRTILQPAQYHKAVARGSAKQASNVEWVDPITLGMLCKLQVQQAGGLVV